MGYCTLKGRWLIATRGWVEGVRFFPLSLAFLYFYFVFLGTPLAHWRNSDVHRIIQVVSYYEVIKACSPAVLTLTLIHSTR